MGVKPMSRTILPKNKDTFCLIIRVSQAFAFDGLFILGGGSENTIVQG